MHAPRVDLARHGNVPLVGVGVDRRGPNDSSAGLIDSCLQLAAAVGPGVLIASG